ncbi:unnamed protein product, partial [Rotaria socialis]
MPSYLIPSLETLPVEIVHRIFDNLDAKTILSSLRRTCRRFQTCTNSYEKFVLDLKKMSKPDFELICRLVDPQQVIALILSDDDETLYKIDLFISHFDTKQFSQLHSLTLNGIKERHFKFILKCVNITFLNTFSLVIKKRDLRYRKSTVALLSWIISQRNLRRFEVEDEWEPPLAWPVQCMIQHLRIGGCWILYPYSILQCSPILQKVSISFLKGTRDVIVLTNTLTTPFRHINSLTLENLITKIETLELLLSLMPSLTHFKLIGIGNFFDGNRWEQFIQTNLPFLIKFEFFLEQTRDVDYTHADAQSIIASFRTPFWLEHKKWFVACGYDIDSPRCVELYSIPLCLSSLHYKVESKKITLSTSGTNTDKETSIIDNVRKIQLDVAINYPNDIANKKPERTVGLDEKSMTWGMLIDQFIFVPLQVEEMHHPLFLKVEELEIDFKYHKLSNWAFFVPTLIDLTAIVRFKCSCALICRTEPHMLAQITSLLQQMCNLLSLDLCSPYSNDISSLTAEDVCLMTPSHVRHLIVRIQSLSEIIIVLERLEHLSGAKFYFRDTSSTRPIIKMLKEKRN